jgi:hypothetical protein
MTRRTNKTKTTIYRRHAGRCPIKGQPNNITQCECPLWIQGKVCGEFLRKSLDTRTLSTAEMRQANVERGSDDDPRPSGTGPQLISKTAKGNETVEYAASEFIKTTTGLASDTQTVYRRAVEHFGAWAAKQELVSLASIESSHIRQYFDANKDWKRNTAKGRLIHLRVFFNYCYRTRRWLQFPPTQDRTLTETVRNRRSSALALKL